jgi:hypothetical protein
MGMTGILTFMTAGVYVKVVLNNVRYKLMLRGIKVACWGGGGARNLIKIFQAVGQ